MNTKLKTTEIGKRAESLAVQFLKGKNWQIIAQNYRHRQTEIDIIAQEQNTIVFVEVKYRKSSAFGHPEEAVNIQKQNRIITCATHFILHNNIENDIRFDIVAILKTSTKYEIEHFEDAFY